MTKDTDTISWIHSFKANGRRPDLKRMEALLEKLGNPQKTFPAIHIVGTNGKGSTSSYLQHILTSSGYKAGTFTSPYIHRFNERISIDGKDIPDHDLDQTVQQIKPIIENQDIIAKFGKVTEFELITLIMFHYFATINPVDIAIIEAGIGGSYDSTNVFRPLALVCPSISLDHQDTLGDTLTKIAEHKVGALKKQVPFIFGPMTEEVRQVFYQKVRELASPTYELGQDFHLLENSKAFDFVYQDQTISQIELAMLGQHQKANASLAAMTSLILAPQFPKITSEHIKKGLEKTHWPGRTELIRDNLMLDGAHNEDSIAKLVQVLKSQFGDRTIHVLFAGIGRKPLDKMLGQLADFDLAVTSFDFYEARPLELYPDKYAKVEDFSDWLNQAESSEDFFVLTGSLYFISQVRNYLLSEK
jgi:dihydrofolate synthase/folylpolyglutamate synthase